MKVYPLVGIGLLGSLISNDATGMGDINWENDAYPGFGDMEGVMEEATKNEIRFGFNLGAGVQYPVAENIDLGFELKYQFAKDFDQVVFGINAAYRF